VSLALKTSIKPCEITLAGLGSEASIASGAWKAASALRHLGAQLGAWALASGLGRRAPER
jgi:hypothetical protein